MSQQGERRTANEDEWWGRLYDDEPVPDTGPAQGDDDTLDARFDSATDTLSPPPPGREAAGATAAADVRRPPPPPPQPPVPRRPEAPRTGPAPEPPPWWAAGRPPEPAEKHPPAPPFPPPAGPPTPEPQVSSASAPGPGSDPPDARHPASTEPRLGPGPAPTPPKSAPASPLPPPPPPPAPPTGKPRPASPPAPPAIARQRAPWEPPEVPQVPPARRESEPPPAENRRPGTAAAPHRTPQARAPRDAAAPPPPVPPRPAPPAPPYGGAPPDPYAGRPAENAGAGSDGRREEDQDRRPRADFVGDRPPTYDAEPTALPAADPRELGALVADTVLDGARYGTYTLRAASVRGDSARYRGEPRRDALLTARFGSGAGALVLVAVAGGSRAAGNAHLAAADACRWIGEAVGRSHARLADDIRAGRRGDLKSGLHRLTDRGYGKLRARASELGLEPEEYTASLRCLLLPADPACRTRVFFGIGGGGLFRLRGGSWQDIEPAVPEPAAVTGAPVVGFGSPPSETPEGDRLTMDLGITTPPSPYVESVPPPTEPFRFRASVARPGDTLLLCSPGLAEPLRDEPSLAKELAERWAPAEPPGLAAYLADTSLRVKGYADDRTAVAVWEA
ncbi:protein phosphatase 2C domain-containing protein [Streptomyces sp. ISL-99]|uniref:protein phosphatase 2C domain-containing protein n=1 Tax=Streptomyces sp. ISL-99 TaxID=2819193 RepID=UPI001BE592BA|nr:protein phosphatase 2C domain-containing protein [Streptomyces sp. ISL-99]MBT2526212.1 protein phosphatase 2C domain-containing protein [Streptomyces sp. ISL-99]